MSHSKKFIVGLTGGIGSGKSEAALFFSQRGVDVIDADIVAREVVKPGTHELTAIISHFGRQILTTDQNLDRTKLRQIIFKDPNQKQWLEALLHPAIDLQIREKINKSTSPYTILVSPLLLEAEQHKLVDRVLVIDTEADLQISRAKTRDKASTEDIERIIASQLSREARKAQAHDIIDNRGDLQNLEEQVDYLHQFYLGICSTNVH